MGIETFKILDKDNIMCDKCGSTDVIIIPKWFTTYYVCRNCGNEERE